MQLSLLVGTFAGVTFAHLAPRPYHLGPVVAAAHDVTPLPIPSQIAPVVSVNPGKINKTEAIWTTETVTAYKTFCPSPTSWVQNKKTYTATKSEWVTVTDCPKACTISYKPGPSPTIIPVLPPAPSQNATTSVKPSVYIPIQTTIQSTTTVCPRNSPCSQAPTSSILKTPTYGPKVFANSTTPVSKQSVPIITSRPLTTITTTNQAGRTVVLVSTVPCPTLTSVDQAGSTIIYIPGVPATTIISTKKSGQTVTSIQQQQPGTLISSAWQELTTVVYVPSQTIVSINQAGSVTTIVIPASTSAVYNPGQTVVTTDQAGITYTSISPATTVPGTVSSRPSPSVVQMAGSSHLAAPIAVLIAVGGVALFLL